MTTNETSVSLAVDFKSGQFTANDICGYISGMQGYHNDHLYAYIGLETSDPTGLKDTIEGALPMILEMAAEAIPQAGNITPDTFNVIIAGSKVVIVADISVIPLAGHLLCEANNTLNEFTGQADFEIVVSGGVNVDIPELVNVLKTGDAKSANITDMHFNIKMETKEQTRQNLKRLLAMNSGRGFLGEEIKLLVYAFESFTFEKVLRSDSTIHHKVAEGVISIGKEILARHKPTLQMGLEMGTQIPFVDELIQKLQESGLGAVCLGVLTNDNKALDVQLTARGIGSVLSLINDA